MSKSFEALRLKVEYKDKVLILTIILMVFWLAAIDVVVLMFFRVGIVSSFKSQTDVYLDLYSKGAIKNLPNYIKITQKPIKSKNFTLYRIEDGRYVYVDLSNVVELFKKFIWTLIAWELALTLTVSLLVFAVVGRFVEREKATNEMLSFILLSMSHKLGNFISAQRVNLELLKDDKIKDRLLKPINEMEGDFYILTNYIKNLAKEDKREIRVDLCDEVEKIIKEFDFGDRRVVFSATEKCEAKINVEDFRIAFSETINNAFKYAKSFVEISIRRKSGKIEIVVLNDIEFKPSKSGIGISIIEYISKRNQWIFAKKIENDKFRVVFLV